MVRSEILGLMLLTVFACAQVGQAKQLRGEVDIALVELQLKEENVTERKEQVEWLLSHYLTDKNEIPRDAYFGCLQENAQPYMNELIDSYAATTDRTKRYVIRVVLWRGDSSHELLSILKEKIAPEIARLVEGRPPESVLATSLSDVEFIGMPPSVVQFAKFNEIKSFINQDVVLSDVKGFKLQLEEVRSVMQQMCDILERYPIPHEWQTTHQARRLRDEIDQALVQLEVDIRKQEGAKAVVAYLLSRYISPNGEVLDYEIERYFRNHSNLYMHELLEAFDVATNSAVKKNIIYLLWGFDLNPELENELLARLDLESGDIELNKVMVGLLTWVGNEETRNLLEEIRDHGPAYLQSMAIREINGWDMKKARQNEKVSPARH